MNIEHKIAGPYGHSQPWRPPVSESMISGRVDKLEDIVFRGNGNSLVTKVALIQEEQKDIKETQDRWERIATKLLYGSGSLAAVVGGRLIYDFIVNHFH